MADKIDEHIMDHGLNQAKARAVEVAPQRSEASRKAQIRKNPIAPPIEEEPELPIQRWVALWKRRHPDRACDEDDFDHLLYHFDEDDILLAIRNFPDFGNWSEEINDSGDFRDKFSEILEDVRPSENEDSDDDEGDEDF